MVTDVISPLNDPDGLVSNRPVEEVETKLMIVSVLGLDDLPLASCICIDMTLDAMPASNTWGEVVKAMVKTAGPPQPGPRVIPSNNSSNRAMFGIRDNNLFIIVFTSYDFDFNVSSLPELFERS